MSRIIKFRAWVVPDGMFKEFGSSDPYMATQGEPDIETLSSFMFHYSEEKNIMQFTGLLVDGGKELYYGDIVKHNENTFVVCHRENFGFCLIDARRYNPDNSKLMMKDNWRTYEDVWRMAKYVKIIGNIYEHPALLPPQSLTK